MIEIAKTSLDPFDPVGLTRSLHFLKYVMDRVHHAKEEDALFPTLEQEADDASQETIAKFRSQHTKGHAYLKAAEDLLAQAQNDSVAIGALTSTLDSYFRHTAIHMRQEERILFPLAEEILPRAVDSDLLAHFHRLESLLISPRDYEMYIEFSKHPMRIETMVMAPPHREPETVVTLDRVVLFDDGEHRVHLAAGCAVISDGLEAMVLDPAEDRPFLGDLHVRYVFFSHAYAGASLHRWLTSTDADILVPELWTTLARQGPCDSLLAERLQQVPDEGGLVALGDRDLAILPAHFLHAAAALQIFDPISKTLFSGDVGACVDGDGGRRRVEDFDAHAERILAFFTRCMASRVAVGAWVDMVRQLDVRRIVPSRGPILEGESMVARFLDWCASIECGVDRSQGRYRVPARRLR